MRKALFAAPGLAAIVTTALVALSAPLAGATTNACTSGDGGFCGGQVSAQAAPLELAIGVPAAQAAAGTRIVADTPAVNKRQDFDQRNPANPVNNDKIFKWAPQGVLSNLCITEVGGVQTQLVLMRCTGATNQRWQPVSQAHGFNWINGASGLAMTVNGDTSGAAVQVRSVGTGTGLNKQWNFVSSAP